MIGPLTLKAVGEALYGDRWQSDLARTLAVNVRTLRRWIAEDGAPDDYRPAIKSALELAAAEISSCIDLVKVPERT